MKPPHLGATGRFPQPALDDSDEGELTLAISKDELMGLVRIEFGKPVAWLALPPKEAVDLALLILKHACGDTVKIAVVPRPPGT